MKKLKASLFSCVTIFLSVACGPIGGQAPKESGLYPVVQNGKWGYMNRSGKIIINPQFDGALCFSEALALVIVGKKVGYVNTNGEYVVNPQFDDGTRFSEGLA